MKCYYEKENHRGMRCNIKQDAVLLISIDDVKQEAVGTQTHYIEQAPTMRCNVINFTNRKLETRYVPYKNCLGRKFVKT